jgi:preprotein translocase subunit Sss1
MSDSPNALQELADLPKEFIKDGTQFINRCTKRTYAPTPNAHLQKPSVSLRGGRAASQQAQKREGLQRGRKAFHPLPSRAVSQSSRSKQRRCRSKPGLRERGSATGFPQPSAPTCSQQYHPARTSARTHSFKKQTLTSPLRTADRREFIKISQAVGMGFLIMGAIGYFIKLSMLRFRIPPTIRMKSTGANVPVQYTFP